MPPWLLLVLVVSSVVICVVSLLVASWAIRRLPPDYLLQEPDRARGPGWPSLGLIARNFTGAVVLLMGVSMLLLPGQGVLTILAALALMDFRGKRRLERWLMLRPTVFAAINRARVRAGRPRLSAPQARAAEEGPG